MEELLRRAGLVDAWQSELQELLANLTSTTRQPTAGTARRRKLFFQLQNCIDVCHETDRVSFMALPSNVILNIPIVASLVAEAPLTTENNQFDIEVLSVCPGLSNATLVIGLTQKGFRPGHEPGTLDKSIGYKPSTGSVYKDGVEVYNTSSSSSAAGAAAGASDDAVVEASCVVGDKFSCRVVLNDDEKQLRVYFSKNNHKVYETTMESTVSWFPAVSLKALKEEIRLLQEAPWRSIKSPSEPHGGMKMCSETGYVSFHSNRPDGKHRDALMLSSQPFSRHFSFFEIEIIAMNDKDEVAIGAVPEDYPRRLPGFRPRSVGFHACAGGIFGGREQKADGAPVCVVGDKMGCGVEHRSNGKRIVFFTHNSKSFMEAELNENCPAQLYPAIGIRAHGSGTVSVCIMDPSNWNSPDDDTAGKHAQIDMETEVSEELGEVIVDKETARASFTAPADVAKDAVLVANETLTSEQPGFEIEILYGSLLTVGLVPSTAAPAGAADDDKAAAAAGEDAVFRRHPGFTADSIGYNAETGQVYVDGKSVQNIGKSTYGERVGFTASSDTDSGQLRVSFTKNGNSMFEHELVGATGSVSSLRAAVAMRSAGQVLAVRLLDRHMWACQHTDNVSGGEGSSALLQLVDRELIECPICRDIFTDPRILPCSIHTFCAACLKTYLAAQQQSGSGRRSMSCPVCRTTFTLPPGGISDLPVNSIVTRLLDIRSKINTTQGQGQGQELGQGEAGSAGQIQGQGQESAAAATADE